MPFTPFHVGPALLISGLLGKRINVVAIVLGSTLIDTRAAYCLFTGCLPLHGPWHTYLGATIFALLISAGIYSLREVLHKITDAIGLVQEYSIPVIISSSLIGTFSHVFLDSFLYKDIVPFWPVKSNPLFGLVEGVTVYNVCTVSFLLAGGIYLYRYFSKKFSHQI
jgi:membrane-bound metal-dependent hydrolase YbcI (DUF457 family)